MPPQPLLTASPDLFDQTEPRSLGLTTIPANHTLLYDAADNDFHFCHHPSLVIFDDSLYCAWSNGPNGEDEPTQRILVSSTADGKTWTTPTTLTAPSNDSEVFVAAGFHTHDDTLTAYYTRTFGENFHEDVGLFAITSTDGANWSNPTRITNGFFIEGPRTLANGRLILGGEHVGEVRSDLRMRLLYTDNPDGLTGWTEAPITPTDPDHHMYTEPNVYSRPDGQTIAAFRSFTGYLLAGTTTDNGATWTIPSLTNFPDSRSRFYLGTLPKGSTILINNPSAQQLNRVPLTISISEDGQTFARAFAIRTEPTNAKFAGRHKVDGYQYPNALVWQNSLFIAYSINKEDISVSRIPISELI